MIESPITRTNTAVVMIDHAVGFGNLIRSHTPEQHINATVALAETARTYELPLVLTNGAEGSPPGPLFPQLLEVTGDTPVHARAGNFDAFRTPEFAAAVSAAGRSKLVLSGLMTEGCVLQTALSGLRLGYEVYLAVDASGGETPEAHDAAIQRLIASGVRPITWLSLASELQVTYEDYATVGQFAGTMANHSGVFGLFAAHVASTSPAAVG